MKGKVILWLVVLFLGLGFGLGAVQAQDDAPVEVTPAEADGALILSDGDAAIEPNAPPADTPLFECGEVGFAHALATNPPAWFKFQVGAGHTLAIGVSGREIGNAVDPTITLYAPNGTTQLAYDDDYDGLDPLIHYTFNTAGTYYAKFEDIDGVGGRGAFYVWLDLPIYVSTAGNGSVGGVSYASGDVLRYHKCREGSYPDANLAPWQMFLDVSSLGVSGNTAGFAILPNGEMALSFAKPTTVPGVGTVPPQDIVGLQVTDVGPDTAGWFWLRFDGSDVGLSTSAEAIDSIAVGDSGKLLLSIAGNGKVKGVSGIADEDVLRFTAREYGSTTRGTWDFYFDGSDVGLAAHDVWGLWQNGVLNQIYMSFDKAITGSGANAALGDISVCGVSSFGANSSCSLWWNPPTFGFDASAAGLSGKVDAVDIVGGPALRLFP